MSRIRIALGLALLLTLATSVISFAKGNFSFLVITGADLQNAICITDPALTTNWFAFADLSQGNTQKPSRPGIGYEITRYYLDREGQHAFDALHYYPDTGFVYYDGIVGGWSDYDGKWYTANPKIKAIFANALTDSTGCAAPIVTAQVMIPTRQQNPSTSLLELPTVTPMVQPDTSNSQTYFTAPLILTVSTIAILVLVFSIRRSFLH